MVRVPQWENRYYSGRKKAFEYNYGACFRNKDPVNLSNNEFRVNEGFETEEKRKAIGIIAIHEKEILITGEEMFIDYISQRVKEVFESNRDEENDGLFIYGNGNL